MTSSEHVTGLGEVTEEVTDEAMIRRSYKIIPENSNELEELTSWNPHKLAELFLTAKDLIDLISEQETKPQNYMLCTGNVWSTEKITAAVLLIMVFSITNQQPINLHCQLLKLNRVHRWLSLRIGPWQPSRAGSLEDAEAQIWCELSGVIISASITWPVFNGPRSSLAQHMCYVSIFLMY